MVREPILKGMALTDWVLVYNEFNKDDYEMAGYVYESL